VAIPHEDSALVDGDSLRVNFRFEPAAAADVHHAATVNNPSQASEDDQSFGLKRMGECRAPVLFDHDDGCRDVAGTNFVCADPDLTFGNQASDDPALDVSRSTDCQGAAQGGIGTDEELSPCVDVQ